MRFELWPVATSLPMLISCALHLLDKMVTKTGIEEFFICLQYYLRFLMYVKGTFITTMLGNVYIIFLGVRKSTC